ncbi:hypothetical protein CGLO_11586 [Colletotrichum gloeosporioides Cg-14]|uniref:Uncharacterized protein n=1 Tax=Colletotrichum gloeosporioides (strain Cg-14) TaxID=1237896 RepID=T0LLF2_COLGC|nr:hypothetical protein CGLO_11586 [Colletotrichum gloeosporioides Cg-14]
MPEGGRLDEMLLLLRTGCRGYLAN